MELSDLRAFAAVITEGSFSRAGTRLHRTQPAISQAVGRLEAELGQKLFDRAFNPGILTDAGKVLNEYAERLLRIVDEAEESVREVKDLRRGRVLIGTNDAGVPILLPLIARFLAKHPGILVDIRRIHSRHVPVEVIQGNLDFGLMTFRSPERRLRSISLGEDELVVIVYPGHPFAKMSKVTVSEWAKEPIIFHNEPSPARERAIHLAEQRKQPLNVHVAVPTIDGIKLAVEMGMGVSLLPRRCVTAELARKQLIAVPIPELRLPREVRLVRRPGGLSHAATAFVEVIAAYASEGNTSGKRPARRRTSQRVG